MGLVGGGCSGLSRGLRRAGGLGRYWEVVSGSDGFYQPWKYLGSRKAGSV